MLDKNFIGTFYWIHIALENGVWLWCWPNLLLAQLLNTLQRIQWQRGYKRTNGLVDTEQIRTLVVHIALTLISTGRPGESIIPPLSYRSESSKTECWQGWNWRKRWLTTLVATIFVINFSVFLSVIYFSHRRSARITKPI